MDKFPGQRQSTRRSLSNHDRFRSRTSSLSFRSRTPCDAAGRRQRTRPQMRALTCAQTQTLPRMLPRTRTPSRPHVNRRAQHTPWHAMSLERAYSCIIALRVDSVERTVANAADHQQRERPESRTLKCVRTQRCYTRCLARKRSCGHTCVGTRNKRPRTHCLTSERTHASAS